jgi:hypothetical protein
MVGERTCSLVGADTVAGVASRTHYDVLGVASDAPPESVRRAYLDRARLLHPDGYVDATADERAEVERRMQEVNEAWRVLQDPDRRQTYDRDLMPRVDRMRLEAEEGRFANRTDGTENDDAEMVEAFDGTAKIIRGLPWMILVGVLFLIFVFTAFAASDGSTSTPSPVPLPQHSGQCVIVSSTPAGPVTTASDCNAPGAREVVARVATGQPCPTDSERLQTATDPFATCLGVH